MPAWLGPERLASAAFRDSLGVAGVTSLRFPGGSWSNDYDWLACEQRSDDGCFWTWAARPSDFVDLMAGTGLPAIWTLSVNETAQQAAAAVAFFNGDLDDERVIGVDRNGVDWGRVADWSRLRADGGHPDPVRIDTWEFGNEVFGGRPSGGEQCADFGWENTWTCDGTEYMDGDADHDGYLAVRAAMLEVDPDIRVGAVGVPDPSAWSDWGNEVISAGGDDLDFYVIHQYGFDSSPDAAAATSKPGEMWPAVVGAARTALPDGVPIAVTEYNLVSFESGDTERVMTTATNALYLADSLGRLATEGVTAANHWNFANGVTPSGTDYGLIDADGGEPYPTFHAFELWSRAGRELLTVESENPDDRTAVHATRRDDGSLAIVVLRLDPAPAEITIDIDGIGPAAEPTWSSWVPDDPDARAMKQSGPESVPLDDGRLTVSVQPWSMNLVEVPRG